MSSKMGSMHDNTSGQAYLYRSSKAALNAGTKSMSIDLKSKGITVLALHPGWVQTDMGGSEAPLTVEESCQGLMKVLLNASIAQSGKFLNYDGQEILW